MDANTDARSIDFHSDDEDERSEEQNPPITEDEEWSHRRERANVLRIESDSEFSATGTEQYAPYTYSSATARQEGGTVTNDSSSSTRVSTAEHVVPLPSLHPPMAPPPSSAPAPSSHQSFLPSHEEKRPCASVGECDAATPSATSPLSSCPLLSPFLSILQHRERNALRRQAALEAVATSDLSRLVLPDPDTPMAVVGLPPLPAVADAPPSATRDPDGVGPLAPSSAAVAYRPSPFPQDGHHVNSDALNSSEKKQLVKIVVDRALMAAAAENRRYQARQVILASSGGKLAQPYGPPLLPTLGGGGGGEGEKGGASNTHGGDHGPHRQRVRSAGDATENRQRGSHKGGDESSTCASSPPSSSAAPSTAFAPSVNYALDIFHAACDGDAQMIAYNLYYGADINAVGQPNPMYYDGKPLDKRWSFYAPPLVFATAFGRERAVRALLSWGADVHGRSSTGLEAMDYAVKRGYSTIVSILEEEVRNAEAKKPKIVLIRDEL